MGGAATTITAPTMAELKKQVERWEKEAKGTGLYMDAGFDIDRVEETEEGYQILVHAHS